MLSEDVDIINYLLGNTPHKKRVGMVDKTKSPLGKHMFPMKHREAWAEFVAKKNNTHPL